MVFDLINLFQFLPKLLLLYYSIIIIITIIFYFYYLYAQRNSPINLIFQSTTFIHDLKNYNIHMKRMSGFNENYTSNVYHWMWGEGYVPRDPSLQQGVVYRIQYND